MRTIWKFPLKRVDGLQPIEMPIGTRLLHVDMQGKTPCIWASVDPEAEKVIRHFIIIGTGHTYDDELLYLATVMDPPFVWHIFEKE